MWFAAFATLATTAYSAYAQNQAGKYNKKISKWNASVADAQAQDALKRGYDAEMQHRRQVHGVIGSQRAGYAGQGIDVNKGIASDLQTEAGMFGEADALRIRNNARREAWGFQVDAKSTRMQSSVDQATTRNQVTGTLITGAANAYGYAKTKG